MVGSKAIGKIESQRGELTSGNLTPETGVVAIHGETDPNPDNKQGAC